MCRWIPITNTLGTGSPEQAPYTDNWSRLFNCIVNWHLCRPEEMKAVLSLGADTSHGSSPFQTLLFGTGLQVSSCIGTNDGVISDAFSVSGNQLYHTAALLMLQKKPRSMARLSVSFASNDPGQLFKLSHHPSLTHPYLSRYHRALPMLHTRYGHSPSGVEFLYLLQRRDRHKFMPWTLVEDEVCRLRRAAKGLRIRMQCLRAANKLIAVALEFWPNMASTRSNPATSKIAAIQAFPKAMPSIWPLVD